MIYPGHISINKPAGFLSWLIVQELKFQRRIFQGPNFLEGWKLTLSEDIVQDSSLDTAEATAPERLIIRQELTTFFARHGFNVRQILYVHKNPPPTRKQRTAPKRSWVVKVFVS